jgi:hypothetical protein
MKSQRQADQHPHEEHMQFEANESREYAWQSKAELQTLRDEMAARVANKQPSLPRSGANVLIFNLDKYKSNFLHTERKMRYKPYSSWSWPDWGWRRMQEADLSLIQNGHGWSHTAG